MSLSFLDWSIIIGFFLLIVGIGLSYTKKAGKDMESFFLGGRNLPWYIAGISMIATTFAADTPLAVTELVGQSGISGNWLWWSFLAGGMLTTFFFARLWRNSEVLTEVELSELRYSGLGAKLLRGGKAIYLGVFMNVIIIAWVNVALMTILEVFFDLGTTSLLGLEVKTSLLITAAAMIWTAIYSSLSGLMGVAITDVIQFIMAMVGTIILAIIVVNSDQIGGIEGMKAQLPEGSLNFMPSIGGGEGVGKTLGLSVGAFFAYTTIQWWASWYPGAEPGGGGYVAQRMMSTRSSKDAVYATLLFQIGHYCLRPWPWIIVGLSAIVLYNFNNAINTLDNKELSSQIMALQEDASLKNSDNFSEKTFTFTKEEDFIKAANGDEAILSRKDEILKINNSLAAISENNTSISNTLQYHSNTGRGYVLAMRDFLPNGLKGLLLIAFFAAYMSTISTQLNWGASYVVNDFYGRFMNKGASEKDLVFASRMTTLILMIIGLIVSTFVNSISGAWGFIMQCGAGLGMVLILRWYWWRINAWSEIAAMLAPFVPTTIFFLLKTFWGIETTFEFSFTYTVLFTTITWLLVTLFTNPTDDETLQHFYNKVKPDGAWRKYCTETNTTQNIMYLFLCWISAIVFTYGVLFLIGKIILLEWTSVLILTAIVLTSLFALRHFVGKTKIFD